MNDGFWRESMRIAAVVAVMSAPLFSQSAYAVNKCKGPDGRIVYSDLPCPTTSEKINAPNLTNAARFYAGGTAFPGVSLSPLPPIDFGPDKDSQLRRASAMVASIKVDARDCDWDLKVTRKFDRCARFLGQMVEGREWTQAMSKLSELAGDTEFGPLHQAELTATLRDAEEVAKIKEFAVLRGGR